jgi:hypothetical protein
VKPPIGALALPEEGDRLLLLAGAGLFDLGPLPAYVEEPFDRLKGVVAGEHAGEGPGELDHIRVLVRAPHFKGIRRTR